jgi:glycosyltransferase involved in cell wall biosynthesis
MSEAEKRPLVSICVPIFNMEGYVDEAFRCIFSQTVQDFEVVVSDNCSTDRSIEIIKAYNDPRIRIFHNDQNYGLLYNFKKVLTYARGEYITYLFADDGIRSDSIEQGLKIMQDHKDVVVVNSYIQIIDDESKPVVVKRYIFGGGKMSSYWGIRSNLLYGSNTVGELNGSLFRRSAYERIPEPKLKNGNTWAIDVDLKNELFLQGPGYMIPEPLGLFRVSRQSTSNKDMRFIQAKMFRKYAYGIYKDKRYNLSVLWLIPATLNSLLLQIARNLFYVFFIRKK